jgi:hypothetical protein
MKKLLFLVAIVGVFAVALPAHAYISTSEAVDVRGVMLRDGDLISAVDYGDPDVFIIKFAPVSSVVGYGTLPDTGSLGYKRLFLNPAIFSMYAHLGGFANVHHVTLRIRDGFTTSGLFRNCETNDQKVWATEVTGEDTGVLHHVQIPGDQVAAQDPNFFAKVFCINTREENFYVKSITPYYRISDIPTYFRQACTVRPACLDATPRCLIPEPVAGWCPSPTPTPSPTVAPTVTSVTAFQTMVEPSPGWWIRIIGTLPTGTCTELLSPYFSQDGNKFLVTLPAQVAATGSCMTSFTQTINLAPASLVPGVYMIYVNGQQWTSFIISSPTPTPTPPIVY